MNTTTIMNETTNELIEELKQRLNPSRLTDGPDKRDCIEAMKHLAELEAINERISNRNWAMQTHRMMADGV